MGKPAGSMRAHWVGRTSEALTILLEQHTFGTGDHLWHRFSLDLEGDGRGLTLLTLHELHIFHLMQTTSRNTLDLDVGSRPAGCTARLTAVTSSGTSCSSSPISSSPPRAGAFPAPLPPPPAGRGPAGRAGGRSRGRCSRGRAPATAGRSPSGCTSIPSPATGCPTHTPPAPRQLRGRLQHLAVLPGHRRPGLPGRLRRRDAAGDRPLLGRHRAARPRGDRYSIRGVLGPDEFHDAYPWSAGQDWTTTPIPTSWPPGRWPVPWNHRPPARVPARRAEGTPGDRLRRARPLAPGEPPARIPFHDGVLSQFDGYHRLAEFDWEGLSQPLPDLRRLDRILEAEGDSVNNTRRPSRPTC